MLKNPKIWMTNNVLNPAKTPAKASSATTPKPPLTSLSILPMSEGLVIS